MASWKETGSSGWYTVLVVLTELRVKRAGTRMWEEAIKRPLGDVRGGVW